MMDLKVAEIIGKNLSNAFWEVEARDQGRLRDQVVQVMYNIHEMLLVEDEADAAIILREAFNNTESPKFINKKEES